MTDILNYDKPRNWRGATARTNNYIFCCDPNERTAQELAPEKKRRGRPRTSYNYIVKIVHDPLDTGGFKPGTEFSILEKNRMLMCGSFTVGTSLIVDEELNFVHSERNKQVLRLFKPKCNR